MSCSPRSLTADRGADSPPPSNSWSTPSWSSAAARRPKRLTASSTPWSRTRPTSRCSREAPGAACPHRRSPPTAFAGCRRSAAGSVGPTFDSTRAWRHGRFPTGAARRAGCWPLSQRRSHRAPEQRARLVGTCRMSPEHLEEELALRLAIGGPLIATRSEAANEVERNYSRAWALCDQLGRSAELFPVLRGLWNCSLLRSDLQRARDLAERLVVLADEQGECVVPWPGALEVQRCSSSVVFRRGGRAGRGHRDRRCGRGLGESSSPSALHGTRRRRGRLYSAWALWFLGSPIAPWRRWKPRSPSVKGSPTHKASPLP